VQTVLLSRWNLDPANHTITLTNMLDGRYNTTGQLTLEAFQVTYEGGGMKFDTKGLAC
jgi:hypothetical protein